MIKKLEILVLSLLFVLLFSCASSPKKNNQNNDSQNRIFYEPLKNEKNVKADDFFKENVESFEKSVKDENTVVLLFAGDIMAHSENYQISSYDKIWRDVKNVFIDCDFSFANIEAPVDETKPISYYPRFNMAQKYVQAAVDVGFNVISLCNNHTNDQFLTGINQTVLTFNRIKEKQQELGKNFYFSGLKENEQSEFSYNIIEKDDWKILFLPVTELLNRTDYADFINFIKTDENSRKNFADYIANLKKKHPDAYFILSLHTSEPEYTRIVTEQQEKFYKTLLDFGVDIIWANHAHIVKNRKIIVNTKNKNDKLIMYSNGNTISGQRRKPDLNSKNPNGERDNTGDGLFYKVTLKKENNGSVKIKKCEPIFITTYINTANEFVLKKLDKDFVNYLYDVQRSNWAKYTEHRIKINKEETKDLIEWQ